MEEEWDRIIASISDKHVPEVELYLGANAALVATMTFQDEHYIIELYDRAGNVQWQFNWDTFKDLLEDAKPGLITLPGYAGYDGYA